MQSKAATVEQYLAELPPDRREAIQAVREVILKNLDPGYREGMQYGMISYAVPHELYPAGYHCDPKQPLPFAGLASQKQYMSLYVCAGYGAAGEAFRKAWAKTGKKLDMGVCCIRFRKVEDLALDLIGESIRSMPVKTFIEFYETQLKTARRGKKPRPGGKPAARRASGRKAAGPAAARKPRSSTKIPSSKKPRPAKKARARR